MDRNVKLLSSTYHELFCCSRCTLILVNPYQLICGDRICYNCMDRQEKESIKCAQCGVLTRYEQCHKDKACARELQELLVKCGSRGCEWEGKYSESQKHKGECDYVFERCEYCGRQMTQIEMREHLNVTNYDGCTQLHRPCVFKKFGCNFEGTTYQLDRHEHNDRHYHYHLLNCVCECIEVPLLYVYT